MQIYGVDIAIKLCRCLFITMLLGGLVKGRLILRLYAGENATLPPEPINLSDIEIMMKGIISCVVEFQDSFSVKSTCIKVRILKLLQGLFGALKGRFLAIWVSAGYKLNNVA